MIKWRYCCIRQNDETDCAAACIATVLKHYGCYAPLAGIRDKAGTDQCGTTIRGIIKASGAYGLAAQGMKALQDKRSLYAGKVSLPAIALVSGTDGMNHFVVIHRITDKAVTVADPARGIVDYSREEFLSMWMGALILLQPSGDFIKTGKNNGMLKQSVRWLLEQKRGTVLLFIASILSTLLGIISTYYFRYLFDDVLPVRQAGILIPVSVFMLAAALLRSAVELARGRLLLKMGIHISSDMMKGYFVHLMELPMEFFQQRKAGEIASRFQDIAKIKEAVSGLVLNLLLDGLMAAGAGVLLYHTDPVLFLVTVIPAAVYILLAWLFRKPFEAASRELMEEDAGLNAFLIQSIQGAQTIKVFQGETCMIRKAGQAVHMVFGRYFRLGMLRNLHLSLEELIRSAGILIVLWIGTYKVLDGSVSAGQLLAFYALLAYFLEPVHRIVGLQPAVQAASAAWNRVEEIMELSGEYQGEAEKQEWQGLKESVCWQNVSFAYGSYAPVIQNASFIIHKGQRAAIIGPSGSGKTTLVNLLLRLYPAAKGEILLDGEAISSYSTGSVRKRIAGVSQNLQFFEGSIRDNLAMAGETVTIEDMVQVCKQIGLHPFIHSLPGGYDTALCENGRNLSQGQRQRLAIARALLKKPDILILDEAFSSLDKTAGRIVEEAVASLHNQVTVIEITHHLSTADKYDIIYILENGAVREWREA